MDDDGQIEEAHSISAGLDYPGLGPEHAWLNDMGRVKFLSATDDEAVAAFQLCSKLEGIIPALEAAHALARVPEIAAAKPKDHLMVVNLSGRGDKDLAVGGSLSRKQESMSEPFFLHLSPEGRDRERSERVRGLSSGRRRALKLVFGKLLRSRPLPDRERCPKTCGGA